MLPQAPQFNGFRVVFTQARPQRMVVGSSAQFVEQMPFAQAMLAPQTLPQRPQLSGSC